MKLTAEKNVHRLFEISLFLKGAHALFEVISGAALAFLSTDAIATFVNGITQAELTEDPQDLVAGYLRHAAAGLSVDTKGFFAWYLLSHGLIKIVLVVALMRNLRWAYPASLIVLGLFILYQGYRYTFAPSIGLIILTLFDLVVLALIWHEYRVSSGVERSTIG